MVVHGGAGLDERARGQAGRYAAFGYVVLACDMLGDGVAGDRGRIVRCLTALRDDPAFMVRRARAGLAAAVRDFLAGAFAPGEGDEGDEGERYDTPD